MAPVPTLVTCHSTTVSWLENASVGGVTALTTRFGNGWSTIAIGRSSISVLFASCACSKTWPKWSARTTTRCSPESVDGSVIACTRVTDWPARIVPVKLNVPKNWSAPTVSSVERKTTSLHVPAASAVPVLVTVHEIGMTCPESASTGAVMSVTARSGKGGSAIGSAVAVRLFASFDSGCRRAWSVATSTK